MPITDLLDQYAAGPALARAAVNEIGREKLRLRPVAGRWSTLEVVCHLSDAEAVYAERMKRVLAEDEPPLRGFDPDVWNPRLACHDRDVDEELELIELVRSQMLRILRPLAREEFQRRGIHSEDGPMTLETLLRRITEHVPHHVRFIEEKKAALAKG
ncbi:MAG TPA: DinB family protein [Pirellulales bacterium]|nr:DinB family protein [Pirellulales bacterium]